VLGRVPQTLREPVQIQAAVLRSSDGLVRAGNRRTGRGLAAGAVRAGSATRRHHGVALGDRGWYRGAAAVRCCPAAEPQVASVPLAGTFEPHGVRAVRGRSRSAPRCRRLRPCRS
jgi:hypothetical protein